MKDDIEEFKIGYQLFLKEQKDEDEKDKNSKMTKKTK